MQYDFFVIGGGSGGVRAARTAAKLGARVAVAEAGPLGGTCVNVGCVPKKLLVYASHYHDTLAQAAGFGWTIDNARFDWPTLIKNKNAEISRLNGVYENMLGQAGVALFPERAQVSGTNTVSLASGKSIDCKHILIATGGQPTKPAIPGVEHGIVSDQAFFLEQLPRRIIIAGGGYIGVEFAGIFHGLGVETLLIHRGDGLLRGFDDDCRQFLAEQMQQQGIDIRLHTEITAIKPGQTLGVAFNNGQAETADSVMFATGRKPNTNDLGLEALGIELTDKGAVVVNDNYTTSVDSIHAVGDVIDRVMLTPMALAEGTLVAERLFGNNPQPPDYNLVPTCIFSPPNMASVGLTEADARDRGHDIDIYRSTFKPMQYSLSDTPLRCLVKLVVEKKTQRVLGAFMVGPEAGEIMQGLAIAMRAGASKKDFDQTLGIHPTIAEEFVSLREPD